VRTGGGEAARAGAWQGEEARAEAGQGGAPKTKEVEKSATDPDCGMLAREGKPKGSIT